MSAKCVQCDDQPAGTGLLCQSCSDKLEGRAGLLPEHVVSRLRDDCDAWLVDPWGQVHGVARDGTTIGRGLDSDLGILHESVSREHAALSGKDGVWTVRDRGSKNGTLVDGERVHGRSTLTSGSVLQVGKACFYFVAQGRAMAAIPPRTIATITASRGAIFRCALQCPSSDRELQLVGIAEGGESPGVVLYREAGSSSWSEMNLTPLEFQLLRVLGERLRSSHGKDEAFVERHVPTAELVRALPFRSDAADEENVRQVVRRTRRAFSQLGVDDLITAVPRRGYRIAWNLA